MERSYEAQKRAALVKQLRKVAAALPLSITGTPTRCGRTSSRAVITCRASTSTRTCGRRLLPLQRSLRPRRPPYRCGAEAMEFGRVKSRLFNRNHRTAPVCMRSQKPTEGLRTSGN